MRIGLLQETTLRRPALIPQGSGRQFSLNMQRNAILQLRASALENQHDLGMEPWCFCPLCILIRNTIQDYLLDIDVTRSAVQLLVRIVTNGIGSLETCQLGILRMAEPAFLF